MKLNVIYLAVEDLFGDKRLKATLAVSLLYCP